ncbi:hypothetical protein DV735_g3305, partial [Chaetothyriales sp. CBS 134920]
MLPWTSIVLFLLASSSQLAAAQFVPPPSDLITKEGYAGVHVRYKEVPTGICELNPHVKSYSGYADVAPDQHIFWWFFEARNVTPSEAPLTVWINGGPGSSSMIGLFQELGPCRVHSDGKPYNNPHSWSTVSNVLFIDQPTQVGFSYSIPVPGYTDPNSGYIVQLPNQTCPEYASDWDCGTYAAPNLTLTANSTGSAAPNIWKTIQGFTGAFPQYSQNGFYFTTESYGGHYGPIFNQYFLEQNANLPPGAHEIDLKAVLIGNGWYDPILQYQAYYNYSVWPGNPYDVDPFNASIKEQFYNNLYGPGNCIDQTIACNQNGISGVCSISDNWCAQSTQSLWDIYSGRDEYDIRYLQPSPFPPEYYVDYLNTPTVQAALGAYVNFSEYSNAVGNNFGSTGDDDREYGTLAAVRHLLANNITVVTYFGDADYNCNWLGGQAVAKKLNAPGYAHAGFVNISTPDGVVHGQVRQAGTYAFVRIYESGHEVPFYQPLTSLTLFSRVLQGRDIATGKHPINTTAPYITRGSPVSDYREGNATVQTQVLDASENDYYYDTETSLPVFTNGTSANTGGGGAREKKRKTKRDRRRRAMWQRAVDSRFGYGSMRLFG